MFVATSKLMMKEEVFLFLRVRCPSTRETQRRNCFTEPDMPTLPSAATHPACHFLGSNSRCGVVTNRRCARGLEPWVPWSGNLLIQLGLW